MATTKRKPLEEGRRTPKLNLSMPTEVQAILLGLATEDAPPGADPMRQRSTTVIELILAERKRRDERAARKKS